MIIKYIKEISKKLNLKHKEQEYRYYIVIHDNQVEIMLIKSNKNLISQLGYFNNFDDCKMVIDKYEKDLLECMV